MDTRVAVKADKTVIIVRFLVLDKGLVRCCVLELGVGTYNKLVPTSSHFRDTDIAVCERKLCHLVRRILRAMPGTNHGLGTSVAPWRVRRLLPRGRRTGI
jgi:hypothetical protein